MREDVLKEKRAMELKRRKWLKDPQGAPPPDPDIINWELKSVNRKWDERFNRFLVIMAVAIPVFIVLFILLIFR